MIYPVSSSFPTTINYSSLDVDTLNFSERLLSNGGNINKRTLWGVDNLFIKPLKSSNVWSFLYDVCLYVGDNLAAALTKLKYLPGTQSILTNVNFIEADYSESTGLYGNAINKYLRTGFTPSSHLASSFDAHLSVYARNVLSTSISNSNYLGSIDSNSFRFFVRRTDTTSKIDYFLGSGTQVNAGFADLPYTGLILGSNISANNGAIYLNGNLRATDTNFTTEARSTRETYIFALNTASNIPNNYSDLLCSFHSFGLGLNGQQVAILYSAVQNLQKFLGREVY